MGPADSVPVPADGNNAPHTIDAPHTINAPVEEASQLGDHEPYAVLEHVGPLVSIDDAGTAEACAVRAAAVKAMLAKGGGAAVVRAALRWRWQTRVGRQRGDRAGAADSPLQLLDSQQLLGALLLNPCSKV